MHGSQVKVLKHKEKLVWARMTDKLPFGNTFTNKGEAALFAAWDCLLELKIGKEERCWYSCPLVFESFDRHKVVLIATGDSNQDVPLALPTFQKKEEA